MPDRSATTLAQWCWAACGRRVGFRLTEAITLIGADRPESQEDKGLYLRTDVSQERAEMRHASLQTAKLHRDHVRPSEGLAARRDPIRTVPGNILLCDHSRRNIWSGCKTQLWILCRFPCLRVGPSVRFLPSLIPVPATVRVLLATKCVVRRLKLAVKLPLDRHERPKVPRPAGWSMDQLVSHPPGKGRERPLHEVGPWTNWFLGGGGDAAPSASRQATQQESPLLSALAVGPRTN